MEVGAAIASRDAAQVRDIIVWLKRCLAALREAPVPTIAAIEGPCLGGGLEVALHCDVRIASDSALFAMPEPRLGFVADVGGTTFLKRLIGPGRASWLITSGRRIDADQAERWGLVEQRCGAGTALEAALALSQDMALGAPVAMESSLSLLRAEPPGELDNETDAGSTALLAGEVMEAMTAHSHRVWGQYSEFCTSSVGIANFQPSSVSSMARKPPKTGSSSYSTAAVPSPRSSTSTRSR